MVYIPQLFIMLYIEDLPGNTMYRVQTNPICLSSNTKSIKALYGSNYSYEAAYCPSPTINIDSNYEILEELKAKISLSTPIKESSAILPVTIPALYYNTIPALLRLGIFQHILKTVTTNYQDILSTPNVFLL